MSSTRRDAPAASAPGAVQCVHCARWYRSDLSLQNHIARSHSQPYTAVLNRGTMTPAQSLIAVREAQLRARRILQDQARDPYRTRPSALLVVAAELYGLEVGA